MCRVLSRSPVWYAGKVLVSAAMALLLPVLTGASPAASQSSRSNPPISSDAPVDAVPAAIRLVQYFRFPYFDEPRYIRKPRRSQRRRYVRPRCEAPWKYSRGLGRCICVEEGHQEIDGKCVKLAEYCGGNGEWSEETERCSCNEGFVERDGTCVDPKIELASRDPDAGLRPRKPAILEATDPDSPVTEDVSVIQECLKEAGYLKGKVSEEMTRRAWGAYRYFKQDYDVGNTPGGVYDARAQHRLFTLCGETAKQLASLAVPARGSDAGSGQAAAASTGARGTEPPKKIFARPEAGCLPEELHNLIVKTYGERESLKRCERTCIPAPQGISRGEMQEYERDHGVEWCRACLEIHSHLPLADILRIERGANVQICTRPPSKLPIWSQPTRGARTPYTRVRELYRAFAPSVKHDRDIAVVIGNKNYKRGLPANESAHNNAGAIYALLTEQLGYSYENIIDMRDATLKELNRIFGSPDQPEGVLHKRIKETPNARLLIYYSGHGSTDAEASESYLLPADAVEHREAQTGYAMSQLYANLAGTGAKSVMVLLEAGFGRDLSDFVFPPNLPELGVRNLPAQPRPGMTVLAAVDRDQRALVDPEYHVGLFTRYLIEGLAGRADLDPIGNNDGTIDAVELYAYTAHMAGLAARKSFGLVQSPVISHQGNERLSTLTTQAR